MKSRRSECAQRNSLKFKGSVHGGTEGLLFGS